MRIAREKQSGSRAYAGEFAKAFLRRGQSMCKRCNMHMLIFVTCLPFLCPAPVHGSAADLMYLQA